MLEQRKSEMLHKQEILFVDDEKNVRDAWQRFLSAENRTVTTAADGETAISGLSRRPIDLVISDLRMPGIDGLDVLEWLHDHKPETRFVLITGYGSPEVERRARALGAFGYLEKPVRPEQLEAIAEAALRGELPAQDGAIAGKALGIVREEREVVVERVEPVVEAALAQARATEPELEVVEAADIEVPNPPSQIRTLAKLALAPIMGFAFIVFLPVIGIGAVCYGVGAKIKHLVLAKSTAVMVDTETKKAEAVESTPARIGTLRGIGRMVAAPFVGLGFIVCLPLIILGTVCYGIGAKIARIFRRPTMCPSVEG